MSKNTIFNTKTKYENEYAIIDEYLANDCEKIKQAYSSSRLDEYHTYYDLFVHIKNLSAFEIQNLSVKTQNRIKNFQNESMKLDNFFEKKSLLTSSNDIMYNKLLKDRLLVENISLTEKNIISTILNNQNKLQNYTSLILEKKYLEEYKEQFSPSSKDIVLNRLNELSTNLNSFVEKHDFDEKKALEYTSLYEQSLNIKSKLENNNDLNLTDRNNLKTELEFIDTKIQALKDEYKNLSFENGLITTNLEYIANMKDKIKNFVSLGGDIAEIPYDNNGKIIAFVNSVSSLDGVNDLDDKNYTLIDEKKFMVKFLNSLHNEEIPDNLTNYLDFEKSEAKLQTYFKDKDLTEFKQILTDIDNDINTYGFNDNKIFNVVKEKYGISQDLFSEYLTNYQRVKSDFSNEEEFYSSLSNLINKKSGDYKDFLFNGDYEDCKLEINGTDVLYKGTNAKFNSTPLYPLNNETDLYKSAKDCNKEFNLENLGKYTENLNNMMNFVNKYQNFGPMFEEYQKAILQKDDERANKIALDLIKKINPNDSFFEEFKSFTQQNSQNISALYREHTSEVNQYNRQIKDLERNVKLMSDDITNPLSWVIPFGLIKNNLNIVGQQLRIYFAISAENNNYITKVKENVNKGFQEFLRDYVNSSPEKKEQLKSLLENLVKSGELKNFNVDKFMKNIENFTESNKSTITPFNDIKNILKSLNNVDISDINKGKLLHGDLSEFKNDISKGFTKAYLSTYMKEAIDTKHVIDTLTSKTETLSTKHQNIIDKTSKELDETKKSLQELELLERRAKDGSDENLDKEQILKDIKLNEAKSKKLEDYLNQLLKLNPILMKETLVKQQSNVDNNTIEPKVNDTTGEQKDLIDKFKHFGQQRNDVERKDIGRY